MKSFLVANTLLCVLAMAPWSSGAITPQTLRCEYKVNPLGMDVAAPRLSWIVISEERAQTQTAYRVIAASTPEKLAALDADLWDSGKVASDATSNVVYAGAPLTSRLRCHWKVMVWDKADQPSAWSEAASWTMGLLDAADWQAKWIGSDTRPDNEDPELMLPPSPYFRKAFAAAKPIRRATLHASALGIYEMSLNGQRIGEDWFMPGWTDYHKRVYCQTYDVTPLVASGDNVLGAILSNGWYAGYVGFGLLTGKGTGRAYYGEVPALLAQLEIEFEDGTTETVATDNTWQTSTGPIRSSDLQMGETYDARREFKGWDQPGFTAAAWKPVTLMPAYAGKLETHPGVPVRTTQEIAPVAITEPKPGVFIFNMGQNFAGCVRLTASGPAGTKITLRHGEMLHNDGTLMTENLRKARAVDTYILKGEGTETWTPRFTFHGFQYVEVTGFPGTPALDAIRGLVVHSDTPRVGQFACDNAMIDQLYSNIDWTQRANFIDLPTDCPQRDERLGWMGDAQIYVRSAACNRDVAAFYTKWLVDVEDAQYPTGEFTDFAPEPYKQETPSPAWMDAGVICPYTMFMVYGDTRLVEKHWDAMVRYMDFLEKNTKNGIRRNIKHCWGDWLSVDADTSQEFIATAYLAYDAKLMAEMAAALGKTDEATRFAALNESTKAAMRKAWIADDARIKDDTQTCYALALSMNLLPDDLKAKAAARLVEGIKSRDGHLSTGFLGVKHSMLALSENGYPCVAFQLLTNTTYPSWGYEVVNGATTIWERWNGYTKEGGCHDPGMNSFSHYSFGAVCEWMFGYMAGVDTDGPGFKRIVIHPQPGDHGINTTRVSYDSINGTIVSDWKIENGAFLLNATIPANTTATIYLPAADAAAVTESGAPAKDAEGLAFARMENGTAVFTAGSGSYAFRSTPPKNWPGENSAL